MQDGNGATTETIANPRQIDLTEADNASGWTETWRKVVAGLPVAFADENGAIRYYTYEASEVQVLVDGNWKSLEEAGYTVTYGVDGTDRVIKITNTHLPMLPETGGIGTWLAVLAGGMLLACAAYERRRRSAACAGCAPAHFAPARPRAGVGLTRPWRLRARGALRGGYLSRRR